MAHPKQPPSLGEHRQLAMAIAEVLAQLAALEGRIDAHYSRQAGLLKFVQRAAGNVHMLRSHLAQALVGEQPRQDGLDQLYFHKEGV